MFPETFEWDAEKATVNFRTHGIAFQEAIAAFRDPFAVERIDDRENYGEERINLPGIIGGVILQVTYAQTAVSSGLSRRDGR